MTEWPLQKPDEQRRGRNPSWLVLVPGLVLWFWLWRWAAVVRRSQDLRPSVGQSPRQVGTATHAVPSRASVEVAVVRDHFLCGDQIVCCVPVGLAGRARV